MNSPSIDEAEEQLSWGTGLRSVNRLVFAFNFVSLTELVGELVLGELR